MHSEYVKRCNCPKCKCLPEVCVVEDSGAVCKQLIYFVKCNCLGGKGNVRESVALQEWLLNKVFDCSMDICLPEESIHRNQTWIPVGDLTKIIRDVYLQHPSGCTNVDFIAAVRARYPDFTPVIHMEHEYMSYLLDIWDAYNAGHFC